MRSALPEIAWPGLPSVVGARLLALQFELERTQWLAPAQLEALQWEQLRVLLAHAADTVPFYSQRFGECGFDPRRDGIEAFRALPFLTRREIQAHGGRLASTRPPAEHGRLMQNLTSGSTGEPVKVLGTEAHELFWRSLLLREHLWQRRDFTGKLCAIRSRTTEVELATWGAPVDEVFATGPSAVLDIRRPVEEQLDWLRRQDCDFLLSHPTNVGELARLCLRTGTRLPRLKEVRTLGEVLSPELRALCLEAWDARVTDSYTCEESGYIALQCPEHEHYHVQSENLVVEILDERGAPCPPGATGRVVITTLHNFAMPLVRYALGDYAEAGPPCPCGRGLPVLKRIHGRQRNMLVLPDGRRFWPSTPVIRYAGIAPLQQMQLVQRTPEHIEARIVTERPLTDGERSGMIAAIRETLGYPFEVTLTPVAAIERSAGLKHEDFKSDVAASAGT